MWTAPRGGGSGGITLLAALLSQCSLLWHNIREQLMVRSRGEPCQREKVFVVRGTINAICIHARGTDTRTLQKTTLAAQCARLSAARRRLCWDVVLTLPLVGSSP
jgi:hypothetical protein